MKPTPEQTACIDAFQTGENTVIEAGAGTGKTTTLKGMGESTKDRGVYLAYNSSIAAEAKGKMSKNINSATAHSFAFKAMLKHYGGFEALKARIDKKSWPDQIARALKLRDAISIGSIPDGKGGNKDVWLKPSRQASIVYEMIQRFCYTTDTQVTARHMSQQKGVDSKDAHWELARYLEPYAQRCWEMLIDPKGQLGWNRMHDVYLTVWALTNPQLPGEFVLFDEAQDANPRVADLVLNQRDSQLVAVGDRCQAIYGWRGAQDAMQSWPAKHRLQLSQSFRFGPTVAEEANKWLELLDAPLRLTGFGKLDTLVGELTDPEAVLCRTNAGVIAEAMQAQQAEQKVAIVGGTADIERFAKAVQLLKANTNENVYPTDHPDLAVFSTWDEVKEYVNNEGGGDLGVLVKLIDNFGVETLINVAAAAVDPRYSKDFDITLSTAHKAKGREWGKVRIGSDFTPPAPDPETGEEKVNPEEAMLAYVSVTRAMERLDKEGLAWVDRLLKRPEALPTAPVERNSEPAKKAMAQGVILRGRRKARNREGSPLTNRVN